MQIYGCTDSTYNELSAEASMEVAINPDSFTLATTITYQDQQPSGTTSAQKTFDKIKPTDLKFELLFDSTGVLANQREFLSSFKPAGEVKSVFEQVEEFRSVAFAFDGTTHKPRNVKLVWGKLIFKGVVKSWSVTYTLFQPDGTPIRAKGSLSIGESIDDTIRAGMEDKNSPDLTHLRTVKAGDTLPQMCHRIYGDSSYYISVAEYNKLNNFRKLEPGTKLYFPPISTSSTSN